MNTIRTALATLALSAGMLAAIGGEPLPGPAADEVSAVELAEWIRAQRPGLLVIDLRDARDADGPGVPGALRREPAHPTETAEFDTIVVYAEGEFPGSSAASLRALWNQPRLLRLHGGMAAWNTDVMFPEIRNDASHRKREAFDRRARLSRYFGGTPSIIDPGMATAQRRSRQGC